MQYVNVILWMYFWDYFMLKIKCQAIIFIEHEIINDLNSPILFGCGFQLELKDSVEKYIGDD